MQLQPRPVVFSRAGNKHYRIATWSCDLHGMVRDDLPACLRCRLAEEASEKQPTDRIHITDRVCRASLDFIDQHSLSGSSIVSIQLLTNERTECRCVGMHGAHACAVVFANRHIVYIYSSHACQPWTSPSSSCACLA